MGDRPLGGKRSKAREGIGRRDQSRAKVAEAKSRSETSIADLKSYNPLEGQKIIESKQIELVRLAEKLGLHDKKVFDLQLILVRSLAFREYSTWLILSKQGSSTPGIDNESIDTGNKAEMFKTLVEFLRDMTYHSNKYQPTATLASLASLASDKSRAKVDQSTFAPNGGSRHPFGLRKPAKVDQSTFAPNGGSRHPFGGAKVKRVWIPKPGKSEKRPLGIPTIRDRAMQSLVNLVLYPLVELTSDPNSYGFRTHRDCKLAIAALRARLRSTNLDIARKALKARFNNYNPGQFLKSNENKWILDADIKGFFDNISHDWLIKNLFLHPTLKSIVNKWLKAKILDAGTYTNPINGTPQGGIISPTLANFTLNGLEDTILKSIYPITKSIEQRKPASAPFALEWSLLPVATRCHPLPPVATRCHPLPPVATRCHGSGAVGQWGSGALGHWGRGAVVHADRAEATFAPNGGSRHPFGEAREGIGRRVRLRDGRIVRLSVGVSVVRYADDFVVVARSKHMLNHYVTPAITKFLLERGLWLSPQKTKTFSLSQKNTQLDFLGYTFKFSNKWSAKRTMVFSRENSNNVIALFPNKEKVRNFILKLKQIISESKNLTAMELIYKLNPMIRGWALYYNLENSSHYRSVVRNALYNMTWNWVRKKHPTLGKKKLALMYFLSQKAHQRDVVDYDSPLPDPLMPMGLEKPGCEKRSTKDDNFIKFKNTKWTFHGTSRTESRYSKTTGKTRVAYLLNPTGSSPILTATKHILPLTLRKVHAFHPKIDELIKFKLGLSLLSSPKTPTLKEKIFKSQKGLCGLCNNPIDFELLHLNTIHIHHMEPINKGGNKFKLSNLTIAHSWCHNKHKH
jgi:retron-type reverse transcriptase